jgi:phage-related protein
MDYATTQFKISLFATQNATAYFDGAVLCEGEDLFTELSQSNILVDDWSPTINIRQDQYELAQREGSEIPDAHVQAQSIRLRGTVVGTDVRSCRTNFDTLLKAALSWKTNEKRHIYLYEDRCREVFLKSFDWQYINSLQYIKYNMQLTDADASSRYIGKIRNRTVIAATVTEFNFAYNGNFESKPYISIIANQGATITTCLLENLTTGENFSYTGTVPSGVALNIDCLAGTVLNSSADSISLFSGDFVRLVRGTNYFRFSGQNCEIDIDYFERYL